ncbi:MAG: hypothetical protein LBV51_04855 [Acholeplasmatales bacterium]|nr:hypothetical protein [Acholeplasmatales bacterium]
MLVCKVPDLYKNIGFKSENFYINDKEYYKFLDNFEDLVDDKLVSELGTALVKPLAILKSENYENAVTVLVSLTGNKNQKLIGIVSVILGNDNIILEHVELYPEKEEN